MKGNDMKKYRKFRDHYNSKKNKKWRNEEKKFWELFNKYFANNGNRFIASPKIDIYGRFCMRLQYKFMDIQHCRSKYHQGEV